MFSTIYKARVFIEGFCALT